MRGLKPPDRRGSRCSAGAPTTNDQAYMLARLPQHWLSRLVFPIGGHEKDPGSAAGPGLWTAGGGETGQHGNLFSFRTDYAAWLEARGACRRRAILWTGPAGCGPAPGYPSLYHRSAPGLGIPAAHRLFVSEIRPETQEVVLSDGTDLMADTVWGRTLTRWPL